MWKSEGSDVEEHGAVASSIDSTNCTSKTTTLSSSYFSDANVDDEAVDDELVYNARLSPVPEQLRQRQPTFRPIDEETSHRTKYSSPTPLLRRYIPSMYR